MKIKDGKLVHANMLYTNGEFEKALGFYNLIAKEVPVLAESLKLNILKCKRNISDKQTVARNKYNKLSQGRKPQISSFNEGDEVLFISHEASLTGAPCVLLKLIKWLVNEFKIRPKIIYCGLHLELAYDFEILGDCLHLKEIDENIDTPIADFLKDSNFKLVYLNTVVSGKILQAVYKIVGRRSIYVSHIHEKENVINMFRAEIELICKLSDKIITVSESTIRYLKFAGAQPNKIRYIPPFIDRQLSGVPNLNIKVPVIWGCGTIESRKGFDLFCETISKLSKFHHIDFKAGWIGPSSENQDPVTILKKYNVTHLIDMIGMHPNPRSFYKDSDVFFLSSREEPFSLATIEAADQGMALLTFDGRCAPEMDKFIRQNGCGLVCEALNTDDAAEALKLLIENPDMKKTMGELGKKAVRSMFTEDVVIPKILDFIFCDQEVGNKRKFNKIFIVSLGPIPIDDIKVIEGGGMRCWGLAKGFAALEPSFEVTLSFPRWFKDSSDLGTRDGIHILTWSDEEELIKQAVKHDVLVFSYCLGGVSRRLANEALPHQTIIMDCYVPIHPEVCARNSDNLIREYSCFIEDKKIWDEVILKADYILCASEVQKSYYFGILFALGKINPINYSVADNIIVAPFGIDGGEIPKKIFNPIGNMVKEGAFKLLWFGGVYPWFDLEVLIEAVKIIRSNGNNVELIIVGAKNPFNSHPDFLRSTRRILEISEMAGYKDFVHVQDWVPFDERFNWYLDSDLVVTFNRDGIENRFAWRTRILDYLQCLVPFATNGGDPISDILIESGLGYIINDESCHQMAESLVRVISKANTDSKKLNIKKLNNLRDDFMWSNIANKIFQFICLDKANTVR